MIITIIITTLVCTGIIFCLVFLADFVKKVIDEGKNEYNSNKEEQ